MIIASESVEVTLVSVSSISNFTRPKNRTTSARQCAPPTDRTAKQAIDRIIICYSSLARCLYLSYTCFTSICIGMKLSLSMTTRVPLSFIYLTNFVAYFILPASAKSRGLIPPAEGILNCYTCSTFDDVNCKSMLHLMKSNTSLVIDGDFNMQRDNSSQLITSESSNPFYPPFNSPSILSTAENYDNNSLTGENDNITLELLNNSSDYVPAVTTNVPSIQCSSEERYCQVRRIEYFSSESKHRKFWAIERGCTSSCRQGCLIIGEGMFVT